MDYIFGSNMVARSVDFDVPDGVLRLDLYQNFLVRPEVGGSCSDGEPGR